MINQSEVPTLQSESDAKETVKTSDMLRRVIDGGRIATSTSELEKGYKYPETDIGINDLVVNTVNKFSSEKELTEDSEKQLRALLIVEDDDNSLGSNVGYLERVQKIFYTAFRLQHGDCPNSPIVERLLQEAKVKADLLVDSIISEIGKSGLKDIDLATSLAIAFEKGDIDLGFLQNSLARGLESVRDRSKGEKTFSTEKIQILTNHWLQRMAHEKGRDAYEKFYDISKDAQRIMELENTQPGSCEELMNNFGIMNFGEYSTEMLLDLLYYKDSDIPYGVMITPRFDKNGFGRLNRESDRIYKEAKSQGFGLRVYEVEGPLSLAKSILGANGKYGKTNKISFMAVSGHGTKDSIRFGLDDMVGRLKLDDVGGKVTEALQECFIENPSIALISCSTGKEDGIGDRIAEATASEVVASERDIFGWHPELKVIDGKPIFEPGLED